MQEQATPREDDGGEENSSSWEESVWEGEREGKKTSTEEDEADTREDENGEEVEPNDEWRKKKKNAGEEEEEEEVRMKMAMISWIERKASAKVGPWSLIGRARIEGQRRRWKDYLSIYRAFYRSTVNWQLSTQHNSTGNSRHGSGGDMWNTGKRSVEEAHGRLMSIELIQEAGGIVSGRCFSCILGHSTASLPFPPLRSIGFLFLLVFRPFGFPFLFDRHYQSKAIIVTWKEDDLEGEWVR